MDAERATVPARPAKVHLPDVNGDSGVVWSVSPEGFHTNLVVLVAGGTVGAHRNDDVDVLVVVLDGAGVAVIDDDPIDVAAGDALLVPRGALRSLSAASTGMRYLTVHAARRPLGISRRGVDDV